MIYDKCFLVVGCSENSEKPKNVRALKTTQNADGDDTDGLDLQRDRLEDNDDGGEDTTKVPPGFLSPSVREYLELGRSIPGMLK